MLIFLFLLSITCNAIAQDTPHNPHSFIIYAYVPWSKGAMHEFNIRPIKVVYEKDYSTDGIIDAEKVKTIAQETQAHPEIPVSFDLEIGNRFAPETVIPLDKTLLITYHRNKPKALVGLYATIPQNIYSWEEDKLSSYTNLNEQYKDLVGYVDFISPSLYNYDGPNFEAWASSARYLMQVSKHYADGKPIFPYISPVYRLGDYSEVKQGTLVEELDEEAMKKRLQLLYDLGAAGCIIWASSQDRNIEGNLPEFAPNKAWGKAVVEFAQSHP